MIQKWLLSLGLFCLSCSSCVGQSNARPKSWDGIKHVVIIVLENTLADVAAKQPFLRDLTYKGTLLTHYYAVTHPSEPNYLALTGGSTFGVTNDNNFDIKAKHIGNLLEAKGLTWKAYVEDYPGKCFLGTASGDYARRHNPFISYVNIQTNPAECNNIVPATQFAADVAANKLPAYSFYIPNVKNDGHDTGIAYADKWLAATFGGYMNDPGLKKNTVFVVTFDEDDDSGDNNVYTVFVGAGVKAGAISDARYDHYSLLKTVEAIFKLGNLGQNDKTASAISDIWNP